MNIKTLTAIRMPIRRNAIQSPNPFYKTHPMLAAVMLSFLVLPAYLVWLGSPPVYAVDQGNLCPRLSQASEFNEFNQIIDCMESHIKGLNARLNVVQGMPLDDTAARAVESDGIKFIVRSARLVKHKNNKSLQVVLSITNISNAKVAAIFIGPSPTADDDDGQFFLIQHGSSIRGFASCNFRRRFDGASASWCASNVDTGSFISLRPNIPLMHI